MSTWELPGSWTHRSFNPAYVWGDQTDQRELDLLVAEAEVNLKGAIDPFALEGTIEWPGVPPGGLDLAGTAQPGVGGELASFEITGSGRPGTNTAGWEYRYEGHLTRRWPDGINQVPTLVGQRYPCERPQWSPAEVTGRRRLFLYRGEASAAAHMGVTGLMDLPKLSQLGEVRLSNGSANSATKSTRTYFAGCRL